MRCGTGDEGPLGEVRPYPRKVTTRPSRPQAATSSVVARRVMVPPGNSLASTMKAMSSGCEKSLYLRKPSTTMIWLCEMV